MGAGEAIRIEPAAGNVVEVRSVRIEDLILHNLSLIIVGKVISRQKEFSIRQKQDVRCEEIAASELTIARQVPLNLAVPIKASDQLVTIDIGAEVVNFIMRADGG